MYISKTEIKKMVVKIRKQIYIEPYQEVMLKRLAVEQGISEAEFIRQAIDDHTQLCHPVKSNTQIWAEEKAFITHLLEQGPVDGQRTWRREDLYEL
jgi:hypothetical protein